jgi:hypothetical protein
MWWQGARPSISSAAFNDFVPVRPKPAPMTERGTLLIPIEIFRLT